MSPISTNIRSHPPELRSWIERVAKSFVSLGSSTIPNRSELFQSQYFRDPPFSTVGIHLRTGSRHDIVPGAQHFLEHINFRGFRDLNIAPFGIVQGLECRGSDLNAFTSREDTMFYSNCHPENSAWSVKMLHSLLSNGDIDRQTVEREKQVILQEFEAVDSSVEEFLIDRIHEISFPGDPLGSPVLGSVDSVISMTTEHLHAQRELSLRHRKVSVVALHGGCEDRIINEVNSVVHGMPICGTGGELRDTRSVEFVKGERSFECRTSLGKPSNWAPTGVAMWPMPSGTDTEVLAGLWNRFTKHKRSYGRAFASRYEVPVFFRGEQVESFLLFVGSENRPALTLSPLIDKATRDKAIELAILKGGTGTLDPRKLIKQQTEDFIKWIMTELNEDQLMGTILDIVTEITGSIPDPSGSEGLMTICTGKFNIERLGRISLESIRSVIEKRWCVADRSLVLV